MMIRKLNILILLIMLFNVSCTPTKRVYKITFTNGDVEYYELLYKVKKDAKVIEYDDDIIIGIESIEEIK